MTLPSGLLPEDCNIEIFASPTEFGKCLFIQNGQTRPFHELPTSVFSHLMNECFKDKKAIKALKSMGTDINAMTEKYNYCNRGSLDGTPDITPSGKTTTEFVNCGRHGKCEGEGRVCSLMGLTFRELECLRLNNKGKDYSQIKSEMGFNSQTAVNSLMSRLRDKFQAKDRTELLIKSHQFGIV